MPEEKKEEAEQSNDGEGDGKEEIPSDIMPLFFTSKTQEIFACKGDEDVTEENPFKLISKEAIEQDFKSRAAISDFHPAKKIIQEYPADEVLVVYDPGFKYGQNYYLCLTEEAKERHLNPPVAEEEGAEGEGAGEEEVFQRKKFPRTPQPWESLGSEIEVEDEIIVENRPKMKFRISRIRREFGAPVSFTTRSATDAKDGIIECPSYEEETPSFLKKELDKGTQVIPEVIDTGNQTEWRKPRNATTQYTPREFDEKEKEEMNKSDSLKEFVEKVTPRFELALQQNEIMDVFYDDYLAMNDDETTFGAKSDSYLKEYQSFTDLQFSKEKTITHIEWHPTIKGIIAVSCGERLAFDDRVDQFSRILMTPSLVLIWSFSDPIHPLILLEAPDDIYSFKFNPSDPNIIAGGCINGQVVMWDISNYSERLKSHRQSHGQSKMNSMNSLPGFEDDSLKDQSPMIRYCAVSSIEHTHKTAVSDIQWIPDHMEIGRMGVVVENRSQHCNQLMTCAADGTVLFWDTRPTKSAAPAQSTTTNPVGIPLPFKHLDLSWKPILKVTVQRITGNGEFGPTFFSITEKQGSRITGNKGEKEPADQTGMTRHSSSLGKSKDQGKPLENVSTKFFVGTEEGDMVYLDWKPEKDTDSGKILTPRPEFVWQAHDGPVITLTRSPFFRDIILTVGGWTFAIWKEGVTSDPLLQSASHILRLTKGHWSPSRPGVFFITKTDGSVDVWDLLDRSHEPSLTQSVTASAITTIYPHQVSGKQQLLAVGDTMGTLHVMEVPWNLRHPSTNEANVMENFFEREVKRLAFVEERKKIRDAEKKEHDAQESRKQQDAKKQEETEADVEAKQRMEYQEYLEMEKKLLEELGIIEEPDEPLET